ncbi:NAD(P)-dependent oxidoreductase [Kitasatospora sp. GAS204B]|uniref:NAD-dependent epimerase/dehydratase family protein n=1 Tax=unclassified Kitasatospora TaxID=2633591 RepID=UPI002473CEE5|nr:NAD-dependent epimerase/dehydratase family protein [Kitasatospora sp. GAS204B]MDH6119824.1 nucleoside-diphosphate-sugar epimerase [Kitasatospora sp. GAS204B]
MRILVTGATGFLGGHLVDRAIREGHQVRALVRVGSDITGLRAVAGLSLVYGDLGDSQSLLRATRDIDVVHHSAARVSDIGTRAQFWEANVSGTERLLDACRRSRVSRLVFVSSPSALMGVKGGDQLDIDEGTPYPDRWLNFYSETKAAAEQRVLAADEFAFTTCALRPRGIWGPRDYRGFVPRMVAAMRAGRLPDLSGGKQVLVSLCHSDNAVSACLRAAQAPAANVGGRAFFVADRERTDLWAFLARLAALFHATPPTRRIHPQVTDALARSADMLWRLPKLAATTAPPLSRYSVALLTRSSTYDTTAAREAFGYTPETDQESGLRRLVEWVDSIGGVEALTYRQPG